MNSTVSQEFGMFCSHTKHLRQILAETQIYFKEINDAASINGSMYPESNYLKIIRHLLYITRYRLYILICFGVLLIRFSFDINQC